MVNSEKLAYLGSEHNKMLEDTYLFLKGNSDKFNAESKRGILVNSSLLEEYLIDKFSSNSNYSKESNDIAIKYTKDLFNNKSFRRAINDKITLTEKEKEYLSVLYKILGDKDKEYNSVIQDIKSLEKRIEADKTLNERELISTLSACSVGKSSYMYWSENIKKWETLSNVNTKYSKSIPRHFGDLAIADAAGAVGGAVSAAAVNAVPGYGQVAYGGAILGGAVAGSAYEGASKILHWVFD